jgi:hypothetical protein
MLRCLPGERASEPSSCCARRVSSSASTSAFHPTRRAIYAIEHANAYNADVASPGDVQEFWERHGELPGFAAGT